MADTSGQQTIDLKRLLTESGHKISFVQVLRLLRLIIAAREDTNPSDTRIFDFIRIRPELGLAFPGTDVVRVEEIERDDSTAFRVTASFMGLYGPSSPLPTFYTEDLIDEKREDRSITREFIDIFNHPFYEHFFNIWEKYSIAHRLAENPHYRSHEYLFCLLGLAGSHIQDSLDHSTEFLSYTGIATQAPRSASGLRTLISDLLQLDQVEVEQCVEHKTDIPKKQHLALGVRNTSIGQDAHIGCCIKDMAGKFRLIIGPLDHKRLQTVLPDTPAYSLILETVQFYVDQPLLWDIELSVARQHIKTACIGSAQLGKLGWNTWLFSGSEAPADGRVPLLGTCTRHT